MGFISKQFLYTCTNIASALGLAIMGMDSFSLLQKTNSISVHQQIAQLMLSQVYNIFTSKAPAYHYDRLFLGNHSGTTLETRSTNNFTINRINFKLSLGRTNFFYQASRLWAALPDLIKSSRNKSIFKKKTKNWVKLNVLVKP